MNIKITTLALAAILFCCNSLHSANTTWTWVGGTDVWADKSNWSTTDTDPSVGSGDIVVINDGASTYPILVFNVTVADFIFNGGWFSTNGYNFTSNNDITIYDGNFGADASLITADNIYLYGGSLSMQGDKVNVNNDVVIDGGTFTVISADVVIPDDLFLTSGTLNLRGYDLFVTDEYTFEGGTIANAVKLDITNLIIDFAGTHTLDYTLNITTSAQFIGGIIESSSTNLITFDYNSSASGASNGSHVKGPIRRFVRTTGNTTFEFPTGTGSIFAPIEISDFASERAQDYFTAEYFNSNAPYNHNSKDVSLDHISSAEYWMLNRAASTGTATTAVRVRLSYDEVNRSGTVDNSTQLRVARFDGTTWRDHGRANPTGANQNVAGTFRSSARVTSFSPFTIGSTSTLNPLPVSLLNFNAVALDKQVKVLWSTTSEINNDFFTVQKSIDGKNWSVIGIVDGVENSEQLTNYVFMDKAPVKGVQFYRLIQTDLNGKSTTSNIVSVNFTSELQPTSITLFPNPAVNAVNVSLSESAGNATIVVFNMMGMKVMELNNLTGSIFNLDLTTFDKGVYTIEVHHENGVSVSKLLKN